LTAPAQHCIFFVDTGWEEEESMHVRVQKWGNSLAVRIPKPLAKDADVTEGTVLNLAVSEGKVIATPVQPKKLTLEQLLSKVTKKNRHPEIDTGKRVAREAW
jgi:antitoxin MazE